MSALLEPHKFNEYIFMCFYVFYVLMYFYFIASPNPLRILFTYENDLPYNFSGVLIPVGLNDTIQITASVSCTKPAVNLVWTGPGKINNNQVVPCADSWTFTSESKLSIKNATKDDAGLISLQVSHPILTKKYEYQLQVIGRYKLLKHYIHVKQIRITATGQSLLFNLILSDEMYLLQCRL